MRKFKNLQIVKTHSLTYDATTESKKLRGMMDNTIPDEERNAFGKLDSQKVQSFMLKGKEPEIPTEEQKNEENNEQKDEEQEEKKDEKNEEKNEEKADDTQEDENKRERELNKNENKDEENKDENEHEQKHEENKREKEQEDESDEAFEREYALWQKKGQKHEENKGKAAAEGDISLKEMEVESSVPILMVQAGQFKSLYEKDHRYSAKTRKKLMDESSKIYSGYTKVAKERDKLIHDDPASKKVYTLGIRMITESLKSRKKYNKAISVSKDEEEYLNLCDELNSINKVIMYTSNSPYLANNEQKKNEIIQKQNALIQGISQKLVENKIFKETNSTETMPELFADKSKEGKAKQKEFDGFVIIEHEKKDDTRPQEEKNDNRPPEDIDDVNYEEQTQAAIKKFTEADKTTETKIFNAKNELRDFFTKRRDDQIANVSKYAANDEQSRNMLVNLIKFKFEADMVKYELSDELNLKRQKEYLDKAEALSKNSKLYGKLPPILKKNIFSHIEPTVKEYYEQEAKSQIVPIEDIEVVDYNAQTMERLKAYWDAPKNTKEERKTAEDTFKKYLYTRREGQIQRVRRACGKNEKILAYFISLIELKYYSDMMKYGFREKDSEQKQFDLFLKSLDLAKNKQTVEEIPPNLKKYIYDPLEKEMIADSRMYDWMNDVTGTLRYEKSAGYKIGEVAEPEEGATLKYELNKKKGILSDQHRKNVAAFNYMAGYDLQDKILYTDIALQQSNKDTYWGAVTWDKYRGGKSASQKKKMKAHSVAEKIEYGATLAEIMADKNVKISFTAKAIRDLSNMMLMNYILGNNTENLAKNLMIHSYAGQVSATGKTSIKVNTLYLNKGEFSFSTSVTGENIGQKQGKLPGLNDNLDIPFLDENVAEAILKTDMNGIIGPSLGLLTAEEMRCMESRINVVKRYIEKAKEEGKLLKADDWTKEQTKTRLQEKLGADNNMLFANLLGKSLTIE